MKVKLVSYLYFVVLIADIIIRLLGASDLDRFVKPLIMPVLLYYLIEKTAGKIYKHHLILAGAMIAAWIGDLLLLNNQKLFILGGIMAFLITQSIYLYLFKSNTKGSLKALINQNKLVSTVLLTCYGTFAFASITLIDGYILFAVLFYGLVVTNSYLVCFYSE